MTFFQSAGRVQLCIFMSSNRARYGIRLPPSFSISPEITSGHIDLIFSNTVTIFLMSLVSKLKGTPELAHCICWLLLSLPNTE